MIRQKKTISTLEFNNKVVLCTSIGEKNVFIKVLDGKSRVITKKMAKDIFNLNIKKGIVYCANFSDWLKAFHWCKNYC